MNLEMLSLITSLQYLKLFASVFYESDTSEQSFPEIFLCQTESHFSWWELVYDFKKKSLKIQSSYTENNIKKHFETKFVPWEEKKESCASDDKGQEKVRCRVGISLSLGLKAWAEYFAQSKKALGSRFDEPNCRKPQKGSSSHCVVFNRKKLGLDAD